MEILRFGNVVLDASRGSLRDGGGAEVALRPKAFDLLLTLARNPRRTLSRDELFGAVWPDVTVTEDSISQCVREVRRAIGDPEGRVLRTIVKRGYCLDVEVQSEAPAAESERTGAAPTEQTKPSLVVLPFLSIPSDPNTDWFADGIVEEITTALSRFRSLFVIARNSAFTFKGQSVDVRDVGQRLGVRYVLEGSVRRAGGQLRVTGQLIEAETGSHIWADRFDGDMADVFELQDRITAAVAGALEPRIRRAEIDRATRKPTADLTAYDLYLRAMPGSSAGPGGVRIRQRPPGGGGRARSGLRPGAQHACAALSELGSSSPDGRPTSRRRESAPSRLPATRCFGFERSLGSGALRIRAHAPRRHARRGIGAPRPGNRRQSELRRGLYPRRVGVGMEWRVRNSAVAGGYERAARSAFPRGDELSQPAGGGAFLFASV